MKPLAAGLDIRRGLQGAQVRAARGEWLLKTEDRVTSSGRSLALLLAVPAPQAIELTRDLNSTLDVRSAAAPGAHGTVLGRDGRRMRTALDAPAEVLADLPARLSWAARDVGKPGRRVDGRLLGAARVA